MKKTFIIFLLISSSSIAQITKLSKPNIIFILADDLGYGDLGCYGQQKTETPNLDRLAANGIKFTQFYSASTVCAPARASFMTGLHTGHTPIRGNKSFPPEGQTPLPDSIITFANILQQNGYATAAFGKWGLGFNTTSGDPLKKGFDHFYGYNCQSLAHDYYPNHLWNNHTKVDLSINLKYDSIYSADLIQQQALNYIKQTNNKPFFMYLPYTLPHGHVIVPHDEVYNYYIKKFNEQPLTGNAVKPKAGNVNAELYPHAAFAAMVSRLDKFVGEIVAEVKANGLEKNTIIIFTSDNGPHKENGGDPVYFNANGGLRGIKRDLYEGGIRVPFIAYWPGKVKPGVSTHIAALWDMYPTFLQLAGVKTTASIDGISILPAILKTSKQKQHDYMYWEFHENDGRQAVRWKNWKGVMLAVNNMNDVPLELYDLSADVKEQFNVAEKYTKIAKMLKEYIKNAHMQNKDWPLLPDEIKNSPSKPISD